LKTRRISRRTPDAETFATPNRPRAEVLRTVVAVTLALALIGTGAIALPSFAPLTPVEEVSEPVIAQLEPETLADIESVHESAGMLGVSAAEVARTISTVAARVPKAARVAANSAASRSSTNSVALKSSTKSVSDRAKSSSRTSKILRATAHEAIKMKRGIIPLIPSKFARAEDGITIPVSLTQYCVQGETRRGRQTRHGIVAADPRIFPLARYVDVFLGKDYLGRYLVDDTGGNVLGATLDIWNPDCREAARFGRHWGSATLVARAVEEVPNDSLVPTRWDGLAKR
jgi:3D (Asp-Asp-Asp) domain-containing protein